MMDFRIIAIHPHNEKLWTQGFQYLDGFIFESHGKIGQSGIKKYIPSGQRKEYGIRLPDYYYAEGLTILEDKVFVLTWHSQICLVFNKSLEYLTQFSYEGEGWGLTNNGTHLIKSNGSQYLDFIDSTTGEVVEQLQVTQNNRPIKSLNELEWVDGSIYANVWTGDFKKIFKIDARNGDIQKTFDLSKIIAGESHRVNGIAYNIEKDNFFVTGKLWKSTYEIELLH